MALGVVCLLGPTASGKTDGAIALLERYGMPIISVDSAQVYRQMDIGTAKPDAETLRRAPHALIDLIEPWESYSVARFLDDVNTEIAKVHAAKKIPVLAGGTMLYFRSLWDGLSDLPTTEPAVREKLALEAQEQGLAALHEKLQQIDPASAARIHVNDPQRILRALEVYEMTGKSLSDLQGSRAPQQQYNFYNIGLFPEDRKALHDRIAARFMQMLELGFEAEVHRLMQLPELHFDLPSMRCVGYRQMWQYLEGECSEAQMIDRATAATRQLAKRQLTWMRSMENCHFVDPLVVDKPSELIDNIASVELQNWISQCTAVLNS